MKLIARIAVIIAAAGVAAPRAQDAPAKVEPLHFHHMHLNSTDPKAAAAYYPKPFALSATATTFNGFDAVKTGNVYILFTKVRDHAAERADRAADLGVALRLEHAELAASTTRSSARWG